MNVIIANKAQTLLGSLSIDVIDSSYGEFDVESVITKYRNYFYNKMIIDVTAIKGYENVETMQKLSLNMDITKVILLLDDSELTNSYDYLSQLVSMGIYNFTRKPETVKFLLDNPNSYKDVASYQTQKEEVKPSKVSIFNDKPAVAPSREATHEKRIIGIKNVTTHAGATTLTYLMKKHLEKAYEVGAVEFNKTDFAFIVDDNLDSINYSLMDNYFQKNNDKEVILVDLNDAADTMCTDVIYLLEPGIIKLNQLIKNDPRIFSRLADKKIVLNRSILDPKDVKDFEKESGSRVFYNIPSVDDKLNNDQVIVKFLISLGFSRIDDKSGKGIFDLF